MTGNASERQKYTERQRDVNKFSVIKYVLMFEKLYIICINMLVGMQIHCLQRGWLLSHTP